MLDGVAGPTGWIGENWAENCERTLFRRAHFSTRDTDSTQDYISRITSGRCHFSVSRRRQFGGFQGVQATLGRTVFQVLKWSGDAECQTAIARTANQHVTLHLPLQGGFDLNQDGRRLAVAPGQILVMSAPGWSRRDWSGPRTILNITIPQDSLARLLAIEFDVEDAEGAEIKHLTCFPLHDNKVLATLISTVIADLTAETPIFHSGPLGRQMERTLHLALLRFLPHRFSERVQETPYGAVPYYVKRAEDFVRRNFRQHLSVEDLVNSAGVSERTLYYGLRTFRNTTPMKLLKRARLDAARLMLVESPAKAGMVSRIASELGYGSVSQFSRDYRELFGESPVGTTRR